MLRFLGTGTPTTNSNETNNNGTGIDDTKKAGNGMNKMTMIGIGIGIVATGVTIGYLHHRRSRLRTVTSSGSIDEAKRGGALPNNSNNNNNNNGRARTPSSSPSSSNTRSDYRTEVKQRSPASSPAGAAEALAAADFDSMARTLVAIRDALNNDLNDELALFDNNMNNNDAAAAIAAVNAMQSVHAIPAVTTVSGAQGTPIASTSSSSSSSSSSLSSSPMSSIPRAIEGVMPPCRALLFDLDGTMADTDHIHADVFAQVFKPYGIECTREIYKHRIAGRSNKLIAKEMVPFLAERETEELFRGTTLYSMPHPFDGDAFLKPMYCMCDRQRDVIP
jgi:hypothetical protein